MYPPFVSLANLRAFRSSDLEPVLEAQALHWQRHFHWDRRFAMGEVRRLLDRRLLSGRVLVSGRSPIGYAHYFQEGGRAVLSDLFVTGDADPQATRLLLEGTLNGACLQNGVRRVEGQLLCLDPALGVCAAVSGELREFPRDLMLKSDLSTSPAPPNAIGTVTFLGWSEDVLHRAARLLAASYRGHVDALINEEYAGDSGSRCALARCTRTPPRGQFLPAAGIVARKSGSSALAGMCLGSMVSDGVGHIAQLCVEPESQGLGLGSELLRRTMRALVRAGCDSVTLTVTASNSGAVRLYERHGFRTIATFPALVWQRV